MMPAQAFLIDLVVMGVVIGIAIMAAGKVPSTFIRAEGPITASLMPQRGSEANSIAVLPFASFSDEQEDGYFADGLTEDVLNNLARVPGLRVVGRTSVFYYKGRGEDVRTIAQRLNVRYVLEGSVRRADDRLRITTQLIEADTGFNLWSATYDRVAENTLDIQRTIAVKVASLLKGQLIGEGKRSAEEDALRQSLPEAETVDPQARRLFLIGLARLRLRGTDNIAAAIDLFERSLAAEPRQAEVLAHLASAKLLLRDSSMKNGRAGDTTGDEARLLIDRALSIDPSCATAFAARGLLYLDDVLTAPALGPREETMMVTAKASLKQAIRLDPRHVEARLWYGILLMNVENDIPAAHEQFEHLLEIDPLFQRGLRNAAGTLTSLGRFGEARALLRQLIDLYPDSPDGYFAAAAFESNVGREDSAIHYTRKAISLGADILGLFNLASHQEALGAVDDAIATYDRILLKMPGNVEALLSKMVLTGDLEAAALLLEQRKEEFKPSRVNLWQAMLGVLQNQPGAVLSHVRAIDPSLLEADTPPMKGKLSKALALMAAHALGLQGKTAQAERLSLALEASWTRQEPVFDLLCKKMGRAASQAVGGRTQAALDTLEAAVEQGLVRISDPICGLMPGSLKKHPYFKSLWDSERFQALVVRVAGQAAVQRKRLASLKVDASFEELGGEDPSATDI